MPLVDPGDHRHQFDRRHAELGEVLHDRRMGKRGDGAAQRLGNVGMANGQRTDMRLVDQPAGREQWRPGRQCWRQLRDDGLGHERRRIAASPRRAARRAS